jgi:SOS-response transcriptional repressor LexA
VFEHRKGEFHDNDIVLAQHAPYADAETGGAFSIKKIEKRGDQIVLLPVNAAYDPITLPAAAHGTEYKIVGTLRVVI